MGDPGLVHVVPVHRQIWEIGTSTHIMGILNVTPDSFSDGGTHADVGAAVEHARAMALAGASIIDVGGQSTRPGAARVTPQEEIARVLPIIKCVARCGHWVWVKPSLHEGVGCVHRGMGRQDRRLLTPAQPHPGSLCPSALRPSAAPLPMDPTAVIAAAAVALQGAARGLADGARGGLGGHLLR